MEMSKDRMGEEVGRRKTVTVGPQNGEGVSRLGEQCGQPTAVAVDIQTNEVGQDQEQQLLPGLPNEIAFDHIVPKLAWRDVQTLASVSRSWERAIRSRQVFDARVRYHSTEALVVVSSTVVGSVHLRSVTNNYSCRLPAIPYLDPEFPVPWSCKFAALDGKLYVLGGQESQGWDGCSQVFVLDLAGPRGEWKQCASMNDRRYDFGCGVKDGRIYVFGGCHRGNTVFGCEVYNPKENSWSRIAPLTSSRCGRDVAIVGEELFVYNGESDPYSEFFSDSDDYYFPTYGPLTFWEVYHPLKDEWRVVEPSEAYRGRVFMAQGKFHRMPELGMDVYDFGKHTWSQSFSMPDCARIETSNVLALHDELVMSACVRYDTDDGLGEIVHAGLFLRSKGFRCEQEEILWSVEKQWSLPREELLFLCTIQL